MKVVMMLIEVEATVLMEGSREDIKVTIRGAREIA